MRNTALLRAACAAAMLMAVPALAQTNTKQESTGTDNKVVAPDAQQAMPKKAAPMSGSSDTMAPKGGMSSASGTQGNKSESMTTHHGAMSSHAAMHASRSDTSQDAAVDRLNQQSFDAAQKGEAFSGAGTASGGMMNSGSGQAGAPGQSKM